MNTIGKLVFLAVFAICPGLFEQRVAVIIQR